MEPYASLISPCSLLTLLQFVITSINLNDTHNFMGSANIYEQATRNKLWDPASGEAFNFAKVICRRAMLCCAMLCCPMLCCAAFNG